MRLFTPYKINLLLHFYAMPKAYPKSRAYDEAVEEFKRLGLIQDNALSDSGYDVTSKGSALINLWCNTRLPEQAWINPETGKIITPKGEVP